MKFVRPIYHKMVAMVYWM